jgi:hypothetical protein
MDVVAHGTFSAPHIPSLHSYSSLVTCQVGIFVNTTTSSPIRGEGEDHLQCRRCGVECQLCAFPGSGSRLAWQLLVLGSCSVLTLTLVPHRRHCQRTLMPRFPASASQ